MDKINLNSKIKEYLLLGLKSNIFTPENIKQIYDKIKDVEIKEDNSLTGDAKAIMSPDGRSTILLNTNRCLTKGDWFLDEVIFHELSHFANEVHRDLYASGEHKVMNFKRQNSQYNYNNPLRQYPEWGAILLDEAISQRIAQTMIEQKYGKGTHYRPKAMTTNLSEPRISFVTDFNDYPEYEMFADKFAKTVVAGGLPKLCKEAVKPNFIDFIFSKYSNKKDGNENLYEILSYFGNIAMADYVSKGHYRLNGSGENIQPQNVYKSIVLVTELLDRNKLIEFPSSNGSPGGDNR